MVLAETETETNLQVSAYQYDDDAEIERKCPLDDLNGNTETYDHHDGDNNNYISLKGDRNDLGATIKNAKESSQCILTTEEREELIAHYDHLAELQRKSVTKDELNTWMEKNTPSILRKNCPPSLKFFLKGLLHPGDCNRKPTDRPDWLDMEKFRRGQKFAVDHTFSLSFANILGLIQLFAIKDGVKPMIFTRRSHTPYLAFTRYYSTAMRLKSWYTSDPWTEGTNAYEDMQAVRQMHLALRQRFCALDNASITEKAKLDSPVCPMMSVFREDFQSANELGDISQCVFLHIEGMSNRPKGMNQSDMSITQFAFVGMAILYAKEIGIHDATDEDLDDFCHAWRGLGYLLGIEDEYNFCRGTLEEVRKRSSDVVNCWIKPNLRNVFPEWEHMCRCLVEGLSYLLVMPPFEVLLISLADILDIEMPRTYYSLSYGHRLQFHVTKWLLSYPMRFPSLVAYLNETTISKLEKMRNITADQRAAMKDKSNRTLANWNKLLAI